MVKDNYWIMKILLINAILIVSMCVSNYGYAQSKIDTISIKDTLGKYQNESYKYADIGWPIRAHISNKSDKIAPYLDSIRSCGYFINKFNQFYCLKVYDKNNILRLEGRFYDIHPFGYIISYNYHGFKIFEGTYGKVVDKKGDILYTRTGEWKFYDVRGRLKETYDYKDGKK
jgi:hypothetical protein